MFCPKCGKENPEESIACLHCGQELESEKILPRYDADSEYSNPGEQEISLPVEEQPDLSAEVDHQPTEQEVQEFTRPLDIPPRADSSIEQAREKALSKEEEEKKRKKKRTIIIITAVIAGLVLILGGILAWLFLRGGEQEPEQTTFSEVTTTTEETTTTAAPTTTQTPTTVDSRELIVQQSNGVFDYDGYVFPLSNQVYLNENDLNTMANRAGSRQKTREYLEYAYYEMFARHGQAFAIQKYIDHFTSYPWYQQLPKREVNRNMLNDYEKDNLDTIQTWQQRYE